MSLFGPPVSPPASGRVSTLPPAVSPPCLRPCLHHSSNRVSTCLRPCLHPPSDRVSTLPPTVSPPFLRPCLHYPTDRVSTASTWPSPTRSYPHPTASNRATRSCSLPRATTLFCRATKTRLRISSPRALAASATHPVRNAAYGSSRLSGVWTDRRQHAPGEACPPRFPGRHMARPPHLP